MSRACQSARRRLSFWGSSRRYSACSSSSGFTGDDYTRGREEKPMKMLAAALAATCVFCVFAHAEGPAFRVDPAWPRPLPEENGVQLVLGQVAGIAVDDTNGHVWIIH